MKKKSVKKLVLAKETVRDLSALDLVKAVGGTIACSGQTSVEGSAKFCNPSGADVC